MRRDVKMRMLRIFRAAAILLILGCLAVPVRADSASEVQNNGGRFVGYQGNVYYWRLKPESLATGGVLGNFDLDTSVKNELICRTDAGEETVLLEDYATGAFFICNDTVFYEKNVGEWASCSLDGTSQNAYPSQIFEDAAPAKGCMVVKDLESNYFLMGADGSLTGLGSFDSYLGIHGDALYFTSNAETEIIYYSIGFDGQNQKELGRIPAVSEVTGMVGITADCIMSENEMYVLAGCYQGTGYFFEGGGIYAIGYDGGVRTLVDAGGSQQILCPLLYMKEGEDGSKLYYSAGVDYSSIGCVDYSVKEGVYAVDLNTGVKETASFELSHVGQRICSDAGLRTLLDNSGEYTQILTPQIVTNLGFGQLNENLSEAGAYVRYLDIVGDTAYFMIMDIREDTDFSFGWRTGYSRSKTQVYALKLGTEDAVLLNDLSVNAPEGGEPENQESGQTGSGTKIIVEDKEEPQEDSEEAEQAAGDKIGSDANAFESVLESLQKKYGVFQAFQRGSVYSAQDNWLDPNGLMSADVLDLDTDGKAEMLACYTEPTETEGVYQITMQVFEEKDGKIFLADSMPMGAYYVKDQENSWNSNASLSPAEWCKHLLEMNAVWAGGNCYIVCEEYVLAQNFANGEDDNTWMVTYQNGSLKYVCSFTQTAGGSSGFVYTGYEFADGELADSAVYYNQENAEEGLYADYATAIRAFFEKFGVKIRDGEDMRHYTDLSSILSDENDRKRIFKFVNDSSGRDGERYDYTAYLISDLVGDGREKASEAENGAAEGENTGSGEDAAAGAQDAANSYVLENSDKVYLTEADIQNLSLREINYAKNEIYARKGRRFLSQELQNYFNSKSWYNGTISPENFTDDLLNDFERANAEFLSRVEFSMSPNGYQLDQ